MNRQRSVELPSWLLRGKVLVPEPPEGHIRRDSLLQRFEGVLERRLTVLRAPAGFGKTTVLADVARSARGSGSVVGWISLDDDDTPNLFGSYLAAAFETAGLDLTLINTHDAWSSLPPVQQMGIMARVIELHSAPCLLVLDEVDGLPHSTVRLISLLVKRAPDNLHVAMAFRSDPGLRLTPQVLDGGATVVGPDNFQFSRAEIARFFEDRLSRRELVRVEERTAGWPVALLAYRNQRVGSSGGSDADAGWLTENYVGVCLLQELTAEARAALLDLAVFDCIDADLVREVLGSTDALARVSALPALDGLLAAVGGDGNAWRLHPLLRDHCRELLSVEDPGRRRSLHGRMASTLARRGHPARAWRHAAAAGDDQLVGNLIERFGVFELWLREGVARLITAGRLLTPEIMAAYPRLELLHCIILRLASRFDEANALFEAVAGRTDGFTRDRDGGDAGALAIDRVFTEGVLAGGAERLPPGEIDSRLPARTSTAGNTEGEPAVALARHTMLCLVYHERARFEESRLHGRQAQARFGEDARFGDIFINTCLGMSAMAQGRVREAAEFYGRARQRARKFFSSDLCLTVSIDVLASELDLERNREKVILQRTLRSISDVRGVWSEVYAAGMAVSAELTFAQHGGETVIPLLRNAVDEVRAAGGESLSHHMSALLAHYLAELGSPDDAEGAWRDGGLPSGASELFDLERRSWRTMEALACARIRLLVGQDAADAAEELARGLCAVASERDLKRTWLRALALSMVVAESAGHYDRSLARLVEFLRLTREVDYVRPLVRHAEVSRTVLARLLDSDTDGDVRGTAESMLLRLQGQEAPVARVFSTRELEVLAGIRQGLRNKEIAARLGISDEGVRYHLRNIYSKTRVTGRQDAVRYAQSIGVRF